MNDMKEKAMGAVRAFLERKGYECLYSIEVEHNSHGKLSTARIEN